MKYLETRITSIEYQFKYNYSNTLHPCNDLFASARYVGVIND